jgi:hypothetical protein
MRLVLIAAVVATSMSALAARAEPPGLVIPVPVEPMPMLVSQPLPEAPAAPASYRWQVVTADAVAIGSLALASQNQSKDLGMFALASYALGAPIVHAANGHAGRALGSLALRVGLPLLGGYLGGSLDRTSNCAIRPAAGDTLSDGCGGDTFPGPGFAKGIAIGAVAAMALDAWLVARPEKQVRRTWSPSAAAVRGGLSLGVAGAF